MSRKWTKTACFKHYGVRYKNIRWSWSGRSEDGRTVAVQFWRDRFTDGGRVYSSQSHTGDEQWFGSPGHKELMENLIWARDHCDGRLRVIIGVAENTGVEPRQTRECYPSDKLIMRLTHLDEITCEFTAERVET